ncbi:MAG: T9SS type A sorting domain-containing protein, partial [Christiangramia sp.]|nr:T9SS type A sorting domain-containing protein [Christiangramia sp.]
KQAIFSKDSRYKIRLKFSSPKGYNRHILVTADAKTTNEFDLGYDAPLIDNIPEDMYWMIGQSEFVIQAVPNFNYNQVLPLGIKIAQEEEFTIEIEKLENFTKDVNIYLHNKEDDTYHNLSVKSYRATEAPGSYNDKYEIVFTKPETEGETGKDKPVVTETPRIIVDYLRDTKEIAIANPDLLQIEHVQLFSMSGQVIKSFEDIQSEKSIRLKVERPLSSAVYIVKVFTSENKYSRKVIIKE